MQYRQGDVLLERVEHDVKGKKIRATKKRHILAHGEATGHAHTVDADCAELVEFEGNRFLRVAAATQLVHQEHAAIDLEPGTYRVSRQLEYSPEEIRRVLD
jgi:hypothetical protein